jgi:V8-like Glu-specific endopeptidase
MKFTQLVSGVVALSLSGCIDGTSLVEATPGSSSYYLQHGYVAEAKALGDQGFASVRAGDVAAARALFERSTAILADGARRHAAEAADRAELQRTLVQAGSIALAVAGALAAGNAASNARTTAQRDAVNRSMNDFASGLQTLSAMATDEVNDAQSRSVASNARSVETDTWRAAVVSDDALARSVVRIRNATSGGYCTGFFVSPYLIMTSAHCFRMGDAVGAYRLIPSDGRAVMRGEDEEIRIVHQYADARYERRGEQCNPFDMALLLTDKPSAFYLPVSTDPPQPGETLLTMGYSGDLNRGFFLRMDYGCKATSGLDRDGRFTHDCASYGGNSGGPVIRAGAGRIAAIGTHSCGKRVVRSTTRVPGRISDSVSLAEKMIASIRTRPEAQGKMSFAPF